MNIDSDIFWVIKTVQGLEVSQLRGTEHDKHMQGPGFNQHYKKKKKTWCSFKGIDCVHKYVPANKTIWVFPYFDFILSAFVLVVDVLPRSGLFVLSIFDFNWDLEWILPEH